MSASKTANVQTGPSLGQLGKSIFPNFAVNVPLPANTPAPTAPSPPPAPGEPGPGSKR